MRNDQAMLPYKNACGEIPDGLVRIGPLTNIAQAIERFDVDAEALFASIGLSSELFTDPDNLISPHTYGELLERCARALRDTYRLPALRVASRAE